MRLNPGPKQRVIKPSPIELYNLADDPTESRDVAVDHADIVAKLAHIMTEQHVPSTLWPNRALDEK